MLAVIRYLWAQIGWQLLGWAGFCLLVGLVFKKASGRAMRACERLWSGLASRRAYVVMLPAAASALLGLLSLPIAGLPVPRVHDEFSYLLAAETFTSGRLANPTHPMWVFLESMHVIQKPTYVSIYPPAQGLVLAAGQKLLGHPWYGVLLSNLAMCAAVAWMLLGWLPRRWALLGGMLAACFSAFSYWMTSYWGGAVAAAGGTLLLGTVPRLRGSLRVRDVLLGACGLAVLANSRPYEGLVLSIPSVALAAVWLVRRCRPGFSALLRKVALPAACILVPVMAAMGFYFWRTTGSPARMPYDEQVRQYDPRGKFFWQSNRPEPVYRHAEIRNLFRLLRREEMTIRQRLAQQLGPCAVLFFSGGALVGVMVFGFWMLRDRRFRPLLVLLFLAVTGYALERWVRPHYVAPVTGIVMALQVQYLRHLRSLRVRGWPMGQLAFWSLLVVMLGAPLERAARRFLEPPSPRDWAGDRQRLQAQLDRSGGQHLIIVRYATDHNLHSEWVYNRADIDGSAVVWAREMEDNAALMGYFRSRRLWLLEPDRYPRWLRPYTPKRSPAAASLPIGRGGAIMGSHGGRGQLPVGAHQLAPAGMGRFVPGRGADFQESLGPGHTRL